MTFNGWRDIVRDCDCKDRCTEFQIFKTRMKALYLSRLYQLSIDSYDTIPHFSDIANEALSQINNSYALDDHDAHSMIKDHHTLLNWFRQYRDNGCSFPNPSSSFTNKHDIHPFLSENPDVIDSINSFCRQNIASMSCESVHQHIHSSIVPQLIATIKHERELD